MGDCFQIQTNDSVRQEEDVGLNLFTNLPTTTHQQHHQISQTIFWCVNDHATCEDDDMNRENIDISDDDEEEEKDKNASQNGTVLRLDKKEIEVIELSDESEDDEQEEENNTNGAVSRDRILITIGLACPECSVLFEFRPKLEQHLLEEHGNLLFECLIRGCNEQFAKRSLLIQHYAEHCTNQTKLICSAVDCQFETSIKKSFVNHVYEYHEKGLFQCAQCLETYSQRIRIFNHFKTLHKHPQNKAHKLFSCPVDSCTFVGRNNCHLKQHQLTHSQLRPFRCTWHDCGLAMNYRSSLIAHIRAKHLHIPRTKKEAAQRNIQCDIDPNQFVNEIFFET